MLTPSTLGLDLAYAIINERVQQAARDALAAEVRHPASAQPASARSASAQPAAAYWASARPAAACSASAASTAIFWPSVASAAPRHWLASLLRRIAVRLDPTVSPDASLVVLKAR